MPGVGAVVEADTPDGAGVAVHVLAPDPVERVAEVAGLCVEGAFIGNVVAVGVVPVLPRQAQLALRAPENPTTFLKLSKMSSMGYPSNSPARK